MTDVERASARVTRLLGLTERLTERLAGEAEAFEVALRRVMAALPSRSSTP